MMKEKNDPTLERIREARRKISAQHGHDIEKMIACYREWQNQIESEKARGKSLDLKPIFERVV